MRAQDLHAVVLLAVVAGLALALFAAYETFNPAAASACSPTKLLSCQSVNSSGHTTTLGVPDWAWGIGGFVALLFVDVLAYRTFERRWLTALFALSTMALGLTAWFVYNEVVVVGAICPVCTGAHLANLVVWAGSLLLLRRQSDSGELDR